jgi:hypothetical protein
MAFRSRDHLSMQAASGRLAERPEPNSPVDDPVCSFRQPIMGMA